MLVCWIWKRRIPIWIFSASLLIIIQISVQSWQMWYWIRGPSYGSSFICSFGTFSGCHGDEDHELIKNKKRIIFLICVIRKGDLPPNHHIFDLMTQLLTWSQAAYVGKWGVRGKLMLIVRDMVFLDQLSVSSTPQLSWGLSIIHALAYILSAPGDPSIKLLCPACKYIWQTIQT